MTNRRPAIPEALHAEAVRTGRLRYCPVCDGYEVTDLNVAVIGCGALAVTECIFLRSYTARVALILEEDIELTEDDAIRIRVSGICIVRGTPKDFILDGVGILFAVSRGRMTFDTVYPALGSDIHSGLAASLGATLTDEGCINVNANQRTNVRGLYAAGDVQRALGGRGGKKSAAGAILYAFDLLYLDGHDLRALSLDERRDMLSTAIKPHGSIRMSEEVDTEGAAFLKLACELGLEGIIAKRRHALYRSGRSGEWLKIKCVQSETFLILGYEPSTAAPGSVACCWRLVTATDWPMSEASAPASPRRRRPS